MGLNNLSLEKFDEISIYTKYCFVNLIYLISTIFMFELLQK